MTGKTYRQTEKDEQVIIQKVGETHTTKRETQNQRYSKHIRERNKLETNK